MADDPPRPALEERVRFEAVVADIASEFVNLDSDRIDDAVQDAQRRIVEVLDLDRSSLFQISDADGRMQFTHFWSRPGFEPLPMPMPGTTEEMFPWGLGKILRGEAICISSLDQIPADVPDLEHFRRFGIKSNVSVPLLVAGRVVGALTFATLTNEREWSPVIVNRLELIAHVFSGALARKRSEGALRETLADNARLRDRLQRENIYLQHEVKEQLGPSEITGHSPAIRRVLDAIEQVAPADATVLLLGETGTGKELLATAIHERSPRAGRPMVRVNCAAIPAALIESELFGREKGAYTGALARQTGRFELAHESTIFLDEIGELSPDLQVKLLRVLQEKQIERLGSSRSIKVDVRIVAATNRDLEQAVASGAFREDLYYRLNVFPIRVPPLRERPEDIPTLVWAFVEEFSRALGKRFESIADQDLEALQRWPWPGNVRELKNTIERSVIVSTGPRLRIDLPRTRPSGHRRSSLQMTDVEREHLRTVLEQTGWKIRGRDGAAEVLGLKPSTLESRLAKLGLRRPER